MGAESRVGTSSPPRLAVICDMSALTLLALAVNLVRIGTKSIDLDQSTSVVYARMSLGSLVRVLTSGESNMGLYYLILNGWVRMFGEREVAVRIPSAIFAALAVGTIYLLGRQLFGRTTGIVAGLLLALNAFVVQYAQTARSYALVVFLITLSSYVLVLEVERPSARTRVGYVIASVLAVYAHYFVVFILFAHLITVAAVRPSSALRREWLRVAAAIVLLCLPAVAFAVSSGEAGKINWIRPATVHDIWLVFIDFAGRSRVVLMMLLASGCLATMFRGPLQRRWPIGFLASWLLVPIAMSFLVSFVKPMFLSYYLIACVPALTLLAAAGIGRIFPTAGEGPRCAHPHRAIGSPAQCLLQAPLRAGLARRYSPCGGCRGDWRRRRVLHGLGPETLRLLPASECGSGTHDPGQSAPPLAGSHLVRDPGVGRGSSARHVRATSDETRGALSPRRASEVRAGGN